MEVQNGTNSENGTGGQLGQIVSWAVPSEVSLETVREGLQVAGLDEKLARDLHPRHIFTRALREMKKGRVICKLKKVSDDLVSFQLTREKPSETGADYEREAVVSMQLSTGRIECDDYEILDRARQLVAEHAVKRLTNDLTRIVQKTYDSEKADLIPIRDQGGVYFVPDQHRELVEKTRRFLNHIDGQLRTFAVRLGCHDTAEAVAESLGDYLKSLITEFRESCEGISHDSKQFMVDRRQDRVVELRRRLECYKGILGAYSDRISSELTKAERELLAKIAQPVSEVA